MGDLAIKAKNTNKKSNQKMVAVHAADNMKK